MVTGTNTPGRAAYERYIAGHPNNPLGERNLTWGALSEVVRAQWERGAAQARAWADAAPDRNGKD